MYESANPQPRHPDEALRSTGVLHDSVIDEVIAELADSGMRIDGFVALATEGLLPNEDLRELWRRHRDVLVPDWAA